VEVVAGRHDRVGFLACLVVQVTSVFLECGRSFTVHGDAESAEVHRRALGERFGLDRSALCCAGARWDVAELMERWMAAEHQWRPATRSSGTSVARFLIGDRLGGIGLAVLTPAIVEAAFIRWDAAGASTATIWARWAVLRSALSWAVTQDHLRSHPLGVMRSPRRPEPRKHLNNSEIATLLATAAACVADARRNLRTKPTDGRFIEALFVAEQTQLLVRLAADTGARRGELAVLRLSDLDGRVLSIERNLSLEVLGPTKSSRDRRLTIGATTATMIHKHFRTWKRRVGTYNVTGDWIFAPDYRRHTHARADLLSHRFERLRHAAGVPDAALHRFRHSAGTQLVAQGHLLKAQARLGHSDPATTPTPCHSTTKTSPTNSTPNSTKPPSDTIPRDPRDIHSVDVGQPPSAPGSP
jgi:integrase